VCKIDYNTLTMLGFIIAIGGDLYDHLMSKRVFSLNMNKMYFIGASTKYDSTNGYEHDLDLLILSH
jgi:hypothetical protein